MREIYEELRATIDPGSMVHFGTFEIGEGHPDHGPFRMICYTTDHRGELTPSRESPRMRGSTTPIGTGSQPSTRWSSTHCATPRGFPDRRDRS
ncbi:hypothetical protein [Streptomyces longwoodensis]|uniref:hypothetical protein n=1 Tax=Streptomyces longwoodensis TaxID=68231 RepID=UPI003F4D0792